MVSLLNRCWLYPFQPSVLRSLLSDMGLTMGGLVLYATMVSVGFICIVGIHPIAVCMALAVWMLPLVAVLMGLGYGWVGMETVDLDGAEALPNWGRWHRHANLGLQMAMYLGFLGCVTWMALQWHWLISVCSLALGLILLPWLFVPISLSRYEPSLINIIQALPVSLGYLNRDYPLKWVHCMAYLVLMVGMVYPVLTGLCLFSGVGVVLVPGLWLCCWVGWMRLVADLFPIEVAVTPVIVLPPPLIYESAPLKAAMNESRYPRPGFSNTTLPPPSNID